MTMQHKNIIQKFHTRNNITQKIHMQRNTAENNYTRIQHESPQAKKYNTKIPHAAKYNTKILNKNVPWKYNTIIQNFLLIFKCLFSTISDILFFFSDFCFKLLQSLHKKTKQKCNTKM